MCRIKSSLNKIGDISYSKHDADNHVDEESADVKGGVRVGGSDGTPRLPNAARMTPRHGGT
jgi:hypothetical protein